MITMEALITSSESSTEAQRKQVARVVGDATEKMVLTKLNELHTDGTLSKTTTQQVLAAGNRVATSVAKAVEAELAEIVSGRIGILQRLFPEKKFVIGPTKGTETLASASDIFGDSIDPDFVNWGCDGEEEPTEEAEGVPFEICENGNYAQIFGGFGLNPEQLCLTTPQIKLWVATHSAATLREDGWRIFLFLFKVKAEKVGDRDKFFVADVYWCSGGSRDVIVSLFSRGDVWNAEDRYLLIVPQQALVT